MQTLRRIAFAIVLLAWFTTDARAGYTHYWTWKTPPSVEKLKAWIEDAREIVAQSPVPLAGPDGEGVPQFEPTSLSINGAGENDSHEPFIFPNKDGFNFCKTQWKPYDVAVTALLIAARDHFSPKELEIGSDGAWGEEWQPGADLYQRALNRTAENPFIDNSSVVEIGSIVSKVILTGLIALIVWLLVNTK